VDYEAIYANSTLAFQESMNKVDILNAMKKNHEEFGEFESIIDSRINVIVGDPIQIRAVYISKYTKTDLTETFIYVKEGKKLN